jgi:putative transposase
MARLPRVVVTDVAHHVTQRGNARQAIFRCDSDRLVYLELLRQHCELYHLSLLGYCLMSNHVHLIAVPGAAQSLALALQHTHGRYAAYWNARQASSGHVWQGRVYSCPLDDTHLWTALRYVELNPVRAGMVESAARWRWSSAATHCGAGPNENWLQMELWQKRWTVEGWAQYLAAGESPADLTVLRQFTHTGRPLGTDAFVAELEKATSRPLAPRPRGRRRQPVATPHQAQIGFVA